jgi:hypothetical protein
MERLEEYRNQVKAFLQDFAADDDTAHLIFDTERDRYLVIRNAWLGEKRLYGLVMHLDIIDEQVWIQHNSTEVLIDQELRDRGIPDRDIILGFRSPGVRSFLAKVKG